LSETGNDRDDAGVLEIATVEDVSRFVELLPFVESRPDSLTSNVVAPDPTLRQERSVSTDNPAAWIASTTIS
jgi:hypothetical protein